MRIPIPALLVGLIFGAGLALSDMINPARVLAFLDIAGPWDPTLAFVMGAAIVPSAAAYAISRRMSRPLLGREFFIPENRKLDPPLFLGAAMFGFGWGLVGFCPGPAISGLVLGYWQPWLFVAAMLIGMLLQRITASRLNGPSAPPSPTEGKTMQSKPLTPTLSVGPQIALADLASAAQRFRAIINNRPDGEEPRQPSSAEIEAEAKRLGLEYRHIPVVPGQLSDDTVHAFADALQELEGPVFAFCRTGTRSTSLWAIGEAARGTPDGVLQAAAGAGYDLGALRPRLEQIARRRPTAQ